MGERTDSFERLLKVERVLIIIFIVATVLFNVLFLLRCRRVSNIFSKPVHCSRLLLSLGSILLAAFSYVIMARGLFQDTDDVSWITGLISKLYFYRLFPCVFGCGLLFQGLSLMCGAESSIQRYTCISRPRVRSVLVAIVPWCLPFVVVFVIAISDEEWGLSGECFESDSSRARLTIIETTCVILPVVAAFICSVIVIRKRRQSPLTQPKEIAYPSTTQGPLTPSAPTPVQPVEQGPVMTPAQPSYPSQAFAEKPETHLHFPQYPSQDVPPQYSPQDAPPEYSAHDPSPHHSQLYPQQYPPVQTQRYSQIGSQWYFQANQHQYPLPYTPPPSPYQAPYLQSRPFTLPAAADVDDVESSKKIRISLVVSCIILALSTLPASLLASSLSCDDLYDSDKDAPLILQAFVFWLMFLYPVAIPFVWFHTVAT